jgi:uncharacterized membrane protein
LFLHFLGLALGLSVSFANLVMAGLLAKAAPPEKAVLSRFPPVMSQLGRIGVLLLWVTGVTLVYSKWGGFAALPWQFHVKLAAVVLLTITVVYAHRLERRVQAGDAAAGARMGTLGKVVTVLALVAIAFAIQTFN